MSVYQFNEAALKPEVLALLQLPEEDYYEPNLSVGDTVNVFDHENIVSMTVYKIEGKEFTLMDDCGFIYLAHAWRWTEDLGDVLMTKNSLRGKKDAGWKSACSCGAKRLSIKKAA